MTAVRLLRVPLSTGCSPTAVLRGLAGDPWPFALTGRWAGGGAILGSAPVRRADASEDPFALLDELPEVVGADAAGDAVGGGWFGWLGYGLGARVEQLPPPPPRPAPLPPFQLAYYDHLLRLDSSGAWWFEALVAPERERAIEQRLDELRGRLERIDEPAESPVPAPRFRIAGDGAAAHVAAVADCRERIAAGEIFQANICLRFEAQWPGGDVTDLFARAVQRLQPAYGAAFPAPWGGIASLSPELFLRRRGRIAQTAPIKGTIARPQDQDDDARARLLASAKDHAEHVMIVDLMRNDLGRVSEYGSVVAARTPEAQAHPGLWHLVSRVQGTLRPEVGDGELLRATFPPGSVTGAPKVQAMHVVNALESTARELYTGAIGYASPLAGLELNVAIRTFEARDGRLWLGAGGGIVADSDPRAELEECFVKVRPLIAAIGGTLDEQRTSVSTAAPSALIRPRRRPDPSRGVFETLLVLDGVAQHADAHLDRLARSVAALYAIELPSDLGARIARAAGKPLAALANGHANGAARGAAPARARLRVVVAPDGTIDVQVVPDRPRATPVPLVPFTLPGGLGSHKWLDRALLDALGADARAALGGDPNATPLLLDGGGAVLEAAWGNVFAVEGDTLVTPPADGRILPGVTRALLIERAGRRVVEEAIGIERLARADAILLTSAAAGEVEAALACAPPEGTRRSSNVVLAS
ncbi:bifunctional chorismate-binding protein/class IV aminotransferase [Conexibacter sp. CPCC 206217]|uniref:bifunctional chorismate-binding protein/class IV aminotransferase n=1 Tax=Conexibacter sp. CPCC 206217 TaxID=3064574 RepID=UPI0027204732|nr:chorismate-binding protein [Conexibacter sp. CPCC 206217]MDO8211960.1 chorismate-binding protein [Conexibacter sp. CPCC 206217]